MIFDKNHSIIAIRRAVIQRTSTGRATPFSAAVSDWALPDQGNHQRPLKAGAASTTKLRPAICRRRHTAGRFLQSLSVGSGDENEKSEKETVKLKRSLYFFCRNDDRLFAELDRKLAVPLIPEFKDYFISELKNRGLLSPLQVCCIGRKFEGWHMNVSSEENEIAAVLEDGLKKRKDCHSGPIPMRRTIFLDIRSFTQYLKQFSGEIADRIQKCSARQCNHPGEQP